MQPGGAETTLLEYMINLSVHFGEKFFVAEVDLPEPEKKTEDMKGIILKKFKYKCSITPQKDKDKALYNTCVEYREKLEFIRQEDARKKREQKERESIADPGRASVPGTRNSTKDAGIPDTPGSGVNLGSGNNSFVSDAPEPRQSM